MNPHDERTLDLIVDSIFAKCAFSIPFMREWINTPGTNGQELIAVRQGVTYEVANRVSKLLRRGFTTGESIENLIDTCETYLHSDSVVRAFTRATDRREYIRTLAIGNIKHSVSISYIVECLEYNLHLAPNKPIDEVTDANPTIQEDNTMTTKFFETKHFLNAQDISQMSDEQIYAAISKKEADIAKLEAINTKPKRLIAQIEEAKGELTALVAHLDKE